jgi:hypothetical protein
VHHLLTVALDPGIVTDDLLTVALDPGIVTDDAPHDSRVTIREDGCRLAMVRISMPSYT